MALSLLIRAILFWGFSNLFFKLAVNRIPTTSVLGWETVGVVLALFSILVYERSWISIADKVGAFWSFIGGFTVMLGGYFFLKVLSIEKLAWAMPFSALNVLVSAILGMLILGEKLPPLHLIGAIGMVICAMLLSTPAGK